MTVLTVSRLKKGGRLPHRRRDKRTHTASNRPYFSERFSERFCYCQIGRCGISVEISFPGLPKVVHVTSQPASLSIISWFTWSLEQESSVESAVDLYCSHILKCEQANIIIHSSVKFLLGWTELSVSGSQVLNQASMEGCEGLQADGRKRFLQVHIIAFPTRPVA